MQTTWLRAIISLLLLGAAANAQETRTGTVQVTVTEAMGMVGGLTVRASVRTAKTDEQGIARLRLPAGSHTIAVTGLGFKPVRAPVIVIADSVVTVKVTIEMAAMVMEEAKVSATRIERLAGESPTRVEVVDEMEVDENTLMAPGGISMLLNETPGIRVVAASPTLGTGSVRILGLPGQYTAMLADGLPLYGGASNALGPLDISPVDLARVEIIKGAASSLYGGQALGGVINLISKPPTGKKELLLNRRTLGVTDAATWLSHRFNDDAGASLLATGTEQGSADVDHDGWADQARSRRWNVRPRLSATDERGRSLYATAGYGYDSRSGGTLGSAVTPDGTAFREALTSRRADAGARVVVPLRDSGNATLRFAVSGNQREREFGPGSREDEGTTTAFAELTRAFVARKSATVVGAAVQRDEFRNSLNAQYDHDWFTPSLFATTDRVLGPVTLSLSARGDAHPDAGVQLTERIAVLLKPVEGWSVRLSAGTGYSAPTATNEETEAIGLRSLRIGPKLRAEHGYGSLLDVNGQLGAVELLVTGYGSVIDDAIQLADASGGSHDVSHGGSHEALLHNSGASTRMAGVEGAAIWRFDGGKFLGTYGYSRGTHPDPTTGVLEEIPMVPRHHVGGDLMLERPGVYRGGIEGIWYGRQALHHDPYRTESKPYLYLMAIAVRELGAFELVANFENLLNVRQTDTDPLVRRQQTTGGRWTTDLWAPVEGFMANVAMRYRW